MIWSLVIVTYNRPEALHRCVELALAQSRLPSEVIIIDASDDWEARRRIMLDGVASRAPTSIRWCYEYARVRGIPSQRNQGIALASGDAVFLIDDDSFMHPGCAEEVMKLYEADVDARVAGISPIESHQPPEPSKPPTYSSTDDIPPPAVGSLLFRTKRLYALLERQLYVERLLLPYDEGYPDHPIPPELAQFAVAPTRYFHGFRMTFRAPIIRQVGFDETLKRYAAAEDMDASYRASRHGVLINAFNARIFHAKAPQERLSRHTSTLLGLLNLAYLYRRKGYHPMRMLHLYRWRVLRRAVIDLVRDLRHNRFSLPCARADFELILRLREFRYVSDDKIEAWYTALQEKIIERNVM